MAASLVPRLEDFHVSRKYGFLLEDPLTNLPEYFQPWMDIGNRLEELIENETIRDEVLKMPLLDHTRLSSHKELRLAQLVLSLTTQGYVWVLGEQGVPAILPHQLAIPLAGISQILEVPPCAVNMGFGLANWKLKDSNKPVELENLEAIITLRGGSQFSWLFMVYAAIELDCGLGLGAMVDGQKAVQENKPGDLAECLKTIELSLQRMKSSLSRMYDHCEPETFYKVIWPHLHSWSSVAFKNKGLGGLIYEGVSTEPKQFLGGSEAVSSTLQSFDAALGVDPKETEKTFYEECRNYMPPSHRDFILALLRGPSIKDYVQNSDNEELKCLYNRCLEALANWRSYHIQMVTRYIILFASNNKDAKKFPNEGANIRSGTETMDFLKNLRNTTKQNAI